MKYMKNKSMAIVIDYRFPGYLRETPHLIKSSHLCQLVLCEVQNIYIYLKAWLKNKQRTKLLNALCIIKTSFQTVRKVPYILRSTDIKGAVHKTQITDLFLSMSSLDLLWNNMYLTWWTTISIMASVISPVNTDVFGNSRLPNHHAADHSANYGDTKWLSRPVGCNM